MAVRRDLAVRRRAPRRNGSHSRDAMPQWHYRRDECRSVTLATERRQRLEARLTDHRLRSLHQLRDRAAAREAKGSHLRECPGRVWGHPRGDRTTARRRARWPRAASSCPTRGPRTAWFLLGRSPGGDWGPSTSRSHDHSKEDSSATRLGRSAWPSDHSVAAVTVFEASRRVTASSHPADWQRSICMQIPGGDGAPMRARRSVRAQLEGHIPATAASDAGLLVSELVTNSVVHANVGPRRALTVEVTPLDDRVRIVVTDPGSRLKPCLLPLDPEASGGLGLLLVNELCETWGVWQDLGPTCVWCELLLDQSPPTADGKRTFA